MWAWQESRANEACECKETCPSWTFLELEDCCQGAWAGTFSMENVDKTQFLVRWIVTGKFGICVRFRVWGTGYLEISCGAVGGGGGGVEDKKSEGLWLVFFFLSF